MVSTWKKCFPYYLSQCTLRLRRHTTEIEVHRNTSYLLFLLFVAVGIHTAVYGMHPAYPPAGYPPPPAAAPPHHLQNPDPYYAQIFPHGQPPPATYASPGYPPPPAAFPPPPPPEPQPTENPRLLKHFSGSSIKEYLKENKDSIPPCDHFKKMPGSCDPELDFNPCVICVSGRHAGIMSTYDGCPDESAFRSDLAARYQFQYGGQAELKAWTKKYICVVKQLPPDATPPGGTMNMMPQQLPGEDSNFMLYAAIGGGIIVVLLMSCIGVACLVMK